MPYFKHKEELRKTGIDFIGDIPRGSHLSFLYNSKEDLLDILLPFFKEGLVSGEFCVWVTSKMVSVQEAKAALEQACDGLDMYLQRGQIEILPCTDVYCRDGVLNLEFVKKMWSEKIYYALTNGFDGVRVAGDAGWLEEKDKRSFMEYEAEVNRGLEGQKIIAFCTYQLSRCSALDIIEIVDTHSHTFARKDNGWNLIQSVGFKKSTTELAKANQQVFDILDRINDAFFALDKEWRLTYINKEAKNFYKKVGFDPEGFTGKKFSELFPEAVGTRFCHEYHKAMSEMVNVHFEERSVYGNKWVEFNVYPSQTGLSVFFRDITDRKNSEEALRETNAYLENLLNYANAPIIVWGPDCRIIRFNRAFERLTGHRADEVLGQSLEVLFPDTQKDKSMALIRRTASGERWEVVEIDIAHVGGAVRTLLWNSATLFAADGTTVVATIAQGQDITERKKSEEALRQSEERFNKAFNAIPLAVAIFSPATGIIVDVNASTVTRSGFSREELIGSKAIDSAYWTEPEEILRFAEEIQQNGHINNYEAKFSTKQGELKIALISGVLININGEDYVLAIANDITELRRYQDEMSRLERLSLIGEISASISHEIRNPMTTVKGFLQLLGERINLPGKKNFST